MMRKRVPEQGKRHAPAGKTAPRGKTAPAGKTVPRGKTAPAGKVFLALGLALAQLAFPATALAESPEFARTEEEWARLRDNVLEYEEIEDLISEYNITVLNNYESWKDSYAGKTADDITRDAWNRIDDAYDQDSIAGDMQARLGEIQIQAEIDEAEDGTIKQWRNTMAEKALVVEAQSAMNTYYQLRSQLEAAEKSRQLTESLLGITQRQQSLGTATAADVLTAQQNLQSADAQIISLRNQMESTRQKLIVMLGWDQTAAPEIRPMPQPDLSRIDAMDPRADTDRACENDYTLKIDQRKLDNSVTETAKATHTANISNDRQQVAVALNTAFQAVQQAKNAYDQAGLSLDAAEQDYSAAQVRQSVGMGTALETLQAEAAAVSARSAKEVAGLQLFQAMETYDWVVKGVRS